MNKPELNDKLAKTKIRKYKTFGGNTVEIMYGAVDKDGNAASPKEDADDGHGIWAGIEINGDYRMFSWKHSKAEGGNTEYGTEFKDKALDTLKEQLNQRTELARKLETMLHNGDSDDTALQAIKDEWAKITTWNVPVEKEIIKRYEKALNAFEPKMEEIKENVAAKSDLLDQAKKLLDAENFKNARMELDKIKDSLHEVGSAGNAKDDEIREQIHQIENTLREKQKDFNEHINESRSQAETKKNEIIAETKKLVSNVSNFKDTNTKLNTLFDQWKAAGSAGHETDEKLWDEFNALRKQFFDARQKFFEDREEQLKKSGETKQKLIEEAKAIVEKNDFSKAATEKMKDFDKKWREAGYSGKDINDTLWDTFTKTKESFWAAKKSLFTKAVQSDLEKAQKELEKINQELEDLEYRLEVAPNPTMKKDVEDTIYVKRNEKTDKEKELEELKKKASE